MRAFHLLYAATHATAFVVAAAIATLHLAAVVHHLYEAHEEGWLR